MEQRLWVLQWEHDYSKQAPVHMDILFKDWLEDMQYVLGACVKVPACSICPMKKHYLKLTSPKSRSGPCFVFSFALLQS